MSDPALDQLVHSLAEFRALATTLVLAKQERRKEGATPAERISTPQHITLIALASGPLAISELGTRTGVAVSSATRMVQGLEREGWVERATEEPGGDRRLNPGEARTRLGHVPVAARRFDGVNGAGAIKAPGRKADQRHRMAGEGDRVHLAGDPMDALRRRRRAEPDRLQQCYSRR